MGQLQEEEESDSEAEEDGLGSITSRPENGEDDRASSEAFAECVGSGLATMIYRLRYVLVLAWPLLAVLLAPSAFLLVVEKAQPMTKQAPRGTESTSAMAVFERHFQDLAIIRREMVVFRCKTICDTAATDLSRGFIEQLEDLVKRFGVDNPGSIVQINSYYTFHGHHQLGENPMLSKDHQSILLQWLWRVPPELKGKAEAFVQQLSGAISIINEYQTPDGLEVSHSGLVSLDHAMKETLIKEVPEHEISTIWFPFIILAMALKSVRMLLLALIPMPIEIIVAFGIMYFVSLQTTVLFYSLMMMLMLCTSLSFDYSLFTLSRYAEERAKGCDVRPAILTVISQSGRVVMISGVVLVISWAAMLGLPVPFNTFCISACAMIITCVLVQLTFVPCLLAILPILGPPATYPQRRKGHSEDSPTATMLKAKGEPTNGGGGHHDESALARAQPHMRGIGFCLGKWLTAFPLNVFVPLAIYAFMMPLTLRFSKNFDIETFKFSMGHSFALTQPRGRLEWTTALRIQQDFPSEVGILMPMLIIATNSLPPSPNISQDTAMLGASPVGTAPLTTVAPLDVRDEEFFSANCRMVNSLISGTSNTSYALTADSFVSATFHGMNAEGTGVNCLSERLISMVRTNYFSRKWFLAHTSKNLQHLWDQLVSKDKSAMLTFLFPTMDPFSPEAFSLVGHVREILHNETVASRGIDAAIPGLTFTTFSPGSILMDLIDVTSSSLPISFLICVVCCLVLIAFWFGALLIPLKLFLTVVVPITWTYGAALYVYQDKYLDWLGFQGLMSMGDAGIDWTVPMFTLTFIVGLAMDYEIFLIERVREFREEGFGDRESIQLGLAATGDTITSAGLIMALTFAAQLLGSIPTMNQMGFILVFSIVVDTFVVRTVLVPAMLSLIPAVNYWPTKMPVPRYEWLSGFSGSPQSPAAGDIRDFTGRFTSDEESE